MRFRSKIVLLLWLFLCLPVAAMSALPVYPDLADNEQVETNGYFEVYAKDGSGFQLVDRLGYDKYFREKTIDLEKYTSGGTMLDVRIIQNGGNAAHIDAVLLDGKPPATATVNNSPINMQKISQKDFDVIDGYDQAFEFSFSSSSAGNVLRLTARVEGDRISKIPFQFPLTNLYRDINSQSDFYAYDMTTPAAGNPLDAVPLLKEWSLSGTGHPNAYTYGWVWHDADNLYVHMDFSGDNTYDGLKDYARVYVNTDDEIKMFKMSVAETRWGNPEFIYTDTVKYQHKVYPFTIPLSELGDAAPETLELAFAAYGTDAPPTVPGPGFYYEALLNTGPGGGEVQVEDENGIIPILNINYKVVAYTTHYIFPEGLVTVDSIQTYEWQTNDFVLIDTYTQPQLPYPIDGNQGASGTKAVEFFTPISNILNFTGSFEGVFHASTFVAANDYSPSFLYPQDPLSIPTLTQWGMIILCMVLLGISMWTLRRNQYRKAIYSVLFVCLIISATVAWAATIIINGDMSDWSGISNIIPDETYDDQSSKDPFTGPNEDIRFGYVTSDDDNIYFRIDYTGAQYIPPIIPPDNLPVK